MKETEIIELLRARDERGIEVFLQTYSPLIKYIASPIIRDEHDVEECVSDVAMRVWEKIGQYDLSKGSFKAWLTAVARNTALNRLRVDKRRSKEEPLSVEGESEMAWVVSADSDPQEAVLMAERMNALSKALKTLSFTDRNIFYRRYYYRQSLAQIGAELGMSERAAEGRLYRIRKQLKKEIGGETDE